jgi:hypothetical protein
MIWWFLILGLSTLAVVCVAIAMYMRVRQHMQGAEPGNDHTHTHVSEDDQHV